VRKARYC